MSKAGKTNTTRPFCLIFEIFMGGSPEGCACFVATPALEEGICVGSIIYIHRIEAGRPLFCYPSLCPLPCLGLYTLTHGQGRARAGP